MFSPLIIFLIVGLISPGPNVILLTSSGARFGVGDLATLARCGDRNGHYRWHLWFGNWRSDCIATTAAVCAAVGFFYLDFVDGISIVISQKGGGYALN